MDIVCGKWIKHTRRILVSEIRGAVGFIRDVLVGTVFDEKIKMGCFFMCMFFYFCIEF